MTDSMGDPITMTPTARAKAAEYLKQDKQREVFRVSIDTNDKLSVALDKVQPGDRTFVQGEVNVALEGPLVELLRGLTIDLGPGRAGKEDGFSFSGPPTADADLGKKARAALAQPAAAHAAHAAGGHSSEADYMKIFFALFFLTVLELGSTQLPVGKVFIILLLVILAFTKAGLVGMYFMHLKFEGRWKHILLVPPALLAVVLVFALMPDVGRTGAWPADQPASHAQPVMQEK
jgi:caa(3)-type oxidase subunit IV